MTLTRIATGLTYAGRQQAALGLHIGGLGLRHKKDIALPAELVAKLTARPKVKEICTALSTAGLTPEGQLTAHLDSKIAELLQNLATQLHSIEALLLPELTQQIAERAQHEWNATRHVTDITAPPPKPPWQRLSTDTHEHDPTAYSDPDDDTACNTNKAQSPAPPMPAHR